MVRVLVLAAVLIGLVAALGQTSTAAADGYAYEPYILKPWEVGRNFTVYTEGPSRFTDSYMRQVSRSSPSIEIVQISIGAPSRYLSTYDTATMALDVAYNATGFVVLSSSDVEPIPSLGPTGYAVSWDFRQGDRIYRQLYVVWRRNGMEVTVAYSFERWRTVDAVQEIADVVRRQDARMGGRGY